MFSSVLNSERTIQVNIQIIPPRGAVEILLARDPKPETF
jgi:hypothetical protein